MLNFNSWYLQIRLDRSHQGCSFAAPLALARAGKRCGQLGHRLEPVERPSRVHHCRLCLPARADGMASLQSAADTRLHDYLDDKLQTYADFTSLDQLISNVQSQQTLLKRQVNTSILTHYTQHACLTQMTA